jgi:hypothetical protein
MFFKESKAKVLRFLRMIANLSRFHYDGYVSYKYPTTSLPGLLGLDRFSFIRAMRIKYWSRIAEKYPPFKPFYDRSIKEKNIKVHADSFVGKIYQEGSTVISDVLNKKELEELSTWLDSLILKETEVGFIQVSVPSELSSVRESILQSLYPAYEAFFNGPHLRGEHCRIYVGARIDYSESGIDKSPQTANWHVDRFVPTLNAIYFPEGAHWGEFEKDIGCPVITSDDRQCWVEDGVRFDKPLVSEVERNMKYNLLGRTSVKYSVAPNSLVVGSHHLQHRRSPFNVPGKRVAIFIDHYDFFTRDYLLAGSKSPSSQ